MSVTPNPTGGYTVGCEKCGARFVHHGPPENIPASKAAHNYVTAGGKDFCGPNCLHNSKINPFQVTGDEAGRLEKERGGTWEDQQRAYQQKMAAALPQTSVHCSRPECKQVFTGPVATAIPSLGVHGWLRTPDGRWVCSQECIAKLGHLPAEGRPVLEVNDAAYQRARAVAKATEAAKLDTTANRLASPVLQPGEELPVPPPRGLRKA